MELNYYDISTQDIRNAVARLGGIRRTGIFMKLPREVIKEWTSGTEIPIAERHRFVLVVGIASLIARHQPSFLELQDAIDAFVDSIKTEAPVKKKREIRRTSSMSIAELRCHINRFGGQTALAKAIGLSSVAVNLWANDRFPVPEKHVMSIRTAIPPYPMVQIAPGERFRPQTIPLETVRRFIRYNGLSDAAKALDVSTHCLRNYAAGRRSVPPRRAELILEHLRGIDNPATLERFEDDPPVVGAENRQTVSARTIRLPTMASRTITCPHFKATPGSHRCET
jgi:DNA-binding transcriptional regulator YdaS (Cro superfamily)